MQEGSNPGSVIQEKTGMEKTGKVQKKQGWIIQDKKKEILPGTKRDGTEKRQKCQTRKTEYGKQLASEELQKRAEKVIQAGQTLRDGLENKKKKDTWSKLFVKIKAVRSAMERITDRKTFYYPMDIQDR